MRNRTSLVLMEVLLMLLVFSLAAAVCVQAFVRSDRIAARTQLQTRAAYLCQNAAEVLKARGDPELAARAEEEGLRLEVQPLPSHQPGLAMAQIRALEAQTGEELFSLTVGWQEVAQ